MARSKMIPDEIREQVLAIVEKYNKTSTREFQIDFKGKYAYLSRFDTKFEPGIFLTLFRGKSGKVNPDKAFKGEESKIGRLEFKGAMDNWAFAVFRYSREFYDPEEFMFPGADKLDGTIEGALKAGEEVYP